MLKVQKELLFLKKKANDQELKLRKDERINTLEGSLHWFRQEALKLGTTCESQKKEIGIEHTLNVDKWKAKSESLEEDRNFLEQQIKAAKRQNKLLKVALGKSQDQCEHLLSITDNNQKSTILPQLMDSSNFDISSINHRRIVH